MDETADIATVRDAAVRLLARREHARSELARKLAERGFPREIVEEALAELAGEGLQSDERFVEAFVRSQFERGVGPARIEAALHERGVSDRSLIGDYLDYRDEGWLDLARQARSKRFGDELPATRRERLRQARFLQGRGFTADQAFRVLGEDDEPA